MSALEAVQLPGLPNEARLVLDLPLETLKSPALPSLISEALSPREIIIYTRADASAVEELKKRYPAATIHAQETLTSEAIRAEVLRN